MQKIILAILILGALAHFYFREKPKVEPEPPPPAPVVAKAEPQPPDLSVIQIKGRSDITNATIKTINQNGITFQCDQGLVQARFSDLSPEFTAYYGSIARSAPPSPARPTGNRPAQSNPVVINNAPRSEPEKTEEWRARRKLYLRNEMKQREDLMERYIRQSRVMNRGREQITSEAYELAKIEHEKLKNEYDSIR